MFPRVKVRCEFWTMITLERRERFSRPLFDGKLCSPFLIFFSTSPVYSLISGVFLVDLGCMWLSRATK